MANSPFTDIKIYLKNSLCEFALNLQVKKIF